jgi:hypothetical protein
LGNDAWCKEGGEELWSQSLPEIEDLAFDERRFLLWELYFILPFTSVKLPSLWTTILAVSDAVSNTEVRRSELAAKGIQH